MSYVISTIDLSSATVGSTGQIDWSVIGLQANIGKFDASARATLSFLNESGFGLQINFTNGQQFYLPAGGWQAVGVAAECTGASYTVLYSLSNPLVTKLLVTWYAPDEPVPPAPILGNSPIGGTVTTSKATFLDAGSIGGFTERDFNPSGAETGPMLISGSSNPSAQTPYLGYWDTTALRFSRALAWGPAPTASAKMEAFIGLQCDTTLGVTGLTTLTGGLAALTAYNSDTLAGNGLASVVAAPQNQSVTGTTQVIPFSLTTPNDGQPHTYRIDLFFILNNGVSGNMITAQVFYTNMNSAAKNFSFLVQGSGGTLTLANGSNSLTNGDYSAKSVIVTCKPNTTLSATYRDPTNTPNDLVTYTVERLS